MQILTLLRILLNRKIFDNEQYGRFCVRRLRILSLNKAYGYCISTKHEEKHLMNQWGVCERHKIKLGICAKIISHCSSKGQSAAKRMPVAIAGSRSTEREQWSPDCREARPRRGSVGKRVILTICSRNECGFKSRRWHLVSNIRIIWHSFHPVAECC